VPRAEDSRSIVRTIVTPRFEIFYALRALESGAGGHLAEWRRAMEVEVPARLRTNLASVAPTPLIWPLLADALREVPPTAGFAEMIETLRRMDDRTFQTFVLGGVFKSRGAAAKLISGSASLSRTIAAEVKTQEKLLAMLGLHPFDNGSPSVIAFERIVSSPTRYRDDVVSVLESFWDSAFEKTWAALEPEMEERAGQLRKRSARKSFSSFAEEMRLPVTVEGDTVYTVRGSSRTAVKSATGIYLLSSAFNTAGFWAAYSDSRGRMRFYIPILDTTLSPATSPAGDPELVFRALGDTTRYAIAASIARQPMTSVELARAFGVSKPTISHHVHALRNAGLLDETPAENGVRLSLNRRAIERLSATASRALFSEDETPPAIRRSRRTVK
jgi:DNA-binding transcriptional ArsR family regulator